MKFRLLERALLLNLLPKQGTFETLIIAEDIKKKINFTQEEIKDFKLETKPTGISWSPEASDVSFPYEFTVAESNLIKTELQTLSTSKQLSSQHIDLYKLFV